MGTLILATCIQATDATAASDFPVPDATKLPAPSADSQQLYEPEFSLFSRDVIGRAPLDDLPKLKNNAREASNLESGNTKCYKVEKSVLFGTASSQTRNELRAVAPKIEDSVDDPDTQLRRRQSISKTLYVSANTCRQPRRASSNNRDTAPPQLILSVSTNDDGCPDITQDTQGVRSVTFEEGAAMLIADASSDVYVSVTAPNVTTEFEDVYNFEIAVSVDDYYYRFDNTSGSELLWVDSDSQSVRLKTNDLTKDQDEVEKIMAQPLPYELFAHNSDSDSINGLRHSVCGLMNEAQIFAKRDGKGKQQDLVKTSMAVRGQGGMPKQEFFFDGLNVSSSYVGILVKLSESASLSGRQESSGTIGGGGTVFQPLQFSTTSGKILLPI
jgi:calcium channel MID1